MSARRIYIMCDCKQTIDNIYQTHEQQQQQQQQQVHHAPLSAHLVSIIFSSLNEFQHDMDVFRNQEAEQVFYGWPVK